MPSVLFVAEGHIADNLFQYFSAEIVKKIYGYDEVKLTFQVDLEANMFVDNEKFKMMVARYMQGDTIPIDTTRNILLMGSFQRSEIFEYERDHLLSLFHKDNETYVNRTVRVKNIVNYQSKLNVQPQDTDLTLYIRLSDSPLYDPAYLTTLIKSIPHQRLFIVHQGTTEGETEYKQPFDELHPTWIHGTVGDDFDFLMRSQHCITTSPFSWMAAFLGQGKEIHIPYNDFYGGKEGNHQNLDEFNMNCKVYYDAVYWTPTSKETPANLESSSKDGTESA